MPVTVQPDPGFTSDFLLRLLNTPSPTGNTAAAVALVAASCQELGLATYRTAKGALVVELPAALDPNAPARTVTAHVDTLGAMVKEIKANGRLKLSPLGGYLPASVVGEYCRVETAAGTSIPGTVVLARQSVHIHSREDIQRSSESLDNLEVRLDERVQSGAETADLGISVGDFVAWEPRAELTPAGFIKSRHLDDKAGVAACLAAAEMIGRGGLRPRAPAYLFISTYEEVGHGGAAGLPPGTAELLVVDMAAVGEGQNSDEFSVSICTKDSSGPYDLELRRRLVDLAAAADIPCRLDIYVNYGSDGSAALRAGADVRAGLIGPGVDSSHAYERTHLDAVMNTARLLVEYLCA